MKWAEVSIRTSHEAMEAVADIFHGLGASGVVVEDPALLNSYLDAGIWDATDLTREDEAEVVTIKAYLPVDSALDGRLREFESRVRLLAEGGVRSGPCDISWSEVEDEDWSESWKQYFHAERVGARVVIRPTWETWEEAPHDIVIVMDPGMAFGTGTHPTTAMCIREIELLDISGMEVTDIGTGTGVLAIAAARLGAAHVTAVDRDTVAIDAARENIARNGVEDSITLGISDLFSAVPGKADLVIANLVADPIIRLMDDLEHHLEPGGVLLISGIIEDRAPDVVEAAGRKNLSVEKIIEERGWAAMLLRREA